MSLFNTVNNSFFIQISSNIVKVCPADEALCLVRLSSFVLDAFSQAFWRKSGIKHKLKMLVYLSST